MQPTVNWQNLDLIAFSSTVTPVAGPGYIPQPSGSTALHRALSYIQAKRPSYTLVISDGRPDDANAALVEADKLTGIIDVLYVGPDNDVQAIAFMQLLATRTGGRVVVNDIGKRPNELASGIRGLLH